MIRAVLSDVHGNYEALRAVLQDVSGRGVQEVHFVGDAVGYGPQPGQCTRLLDEVCAELVAGNHDWAAVGLTDIDYFNPVARTAITWTADILLDAEKEILRSWPLTGSPAGTDMLMVHGTPYEPEQWHYLFDADDAVNAFGHFDERLCVIGHSHVPFIAELTEEDEVYAYEDEAVFRKGGRYIVNVGSVGQPRDGDPRAAYALFDRDVVSIVRVDYDIRSTQLQMTEAGLPDPLIHRLEYGM